MFILTTRSFGDSKRETPQMRSDACLPHALMCRETCDARLRFGGTEIALLLEGLACAWFSRTVRKISTFRGTRLRQCSSVEWIRGRSLKRAET